MEWIKTSGHLHGLHLIHCFARGVECAAEVEWGTSVCVVVFDDEVLHLLCIDERSRERVLLCFDVVVILKTVSSQHLLHFLVWTRSDFVNH